VLGYSADWLAGEVCQLFQIVYQTSTFKYCPPFQDRREKEDSNYMAVKRRSIQYMWSGFIWQRIRSSGGLLSTL